MIKKKIFLNRSDVVGVIARLRVGVLDSKPGRDKRFYLILNVHTNLWGPPNLQLSGYRVSFPGLKRPEREANHWPVIIAEIKNE